MSTERTSDAYGKKKDIFPCPIQRLQRNPRNFCFYGHGAKHVTNHAVLCESIVAHLKDGVPLVIRSPFAISMPVLQGIKPWTSDFVFMPEMQHELHHRCFATLLETTRSLNIDLTNLKAVHNNLRLFVKCQDEWQICLSGIEDQPCMTDVKFSLIEHSFSFQELQMHPVWFALLVAQKQQ